MPQGDSNQLIILLWNVNGLLSKLKRGVVTQFIRWYGPDLVLVQETHLVGNSVPFLNRGKYVTLALSGYTRGSRKMVKPSGERTAPFQVDRTRIGPVGKSGGPIRCLESQTLHRRNTSFTQGSMRPSCSWIMFLFQVGMLQLFQSAIHAEVDINSCPPAHDTWRLMELRFDLQNVCITIWQSCRQHF